jgi:hypothetical protein
MLGAAPMPLSKYPLEPLLRLRDRRVDVAAGELGRSTRALEEASRTRAAAQEACSRHHEAAADQRRVEGTALAAGELRAGDLAVAEAWGLRVEAEARALQGHTDAARADETRAEAHEREAKARLADRKVEAEQVHKHRARFDDARKKVAEARDEEASFEAWRPKR